MSDLTVSPAISPSHAEWLTEPEMEMVFFIERYHAMQGEVPNDDIMRRRWGIDDEALAAFKAHPLVAKSFKHRGINYPDPGDNLTDRQHAAIAAMLDNHDKRSDEKKLRDIGVTTREWSTWLLNDEFASYVNGRAERMLMAMQYEAHKGLVKGARNGNVASIRAFNELTGRHNPDADNRINVSLMLHQFIEVIQKYVRDPVALHGIATDMANIANAGAMQPGVQTIRAQAYKSLPAKELVPDDI